MSRIGVLPYADRDGPFFQEEIPLPRERRKEGRKKARKKAGQGPQTSKAFGSFSFFAGQIGSIDCSLAVFIVYYFIYPCVSSHHIA